MASFTDWASDWSEESRGSPKPGGKGGTEEGQLVIPTGVPQVPLIPQVHGKGGSYLNHLLDAVDGAVHEGLEHVGVIERVCVAHTHEQDVSRQPGNHVHHHTARLQVCSRERP